MSTQSEFDKVQKDRANERQKATNQRIKDIQINSNKQQLDKLRKKYWQLRDEIEASKKKIKLYETEAVQFAKTHPEPRDILDGRQLDILINLVLSEKDKVTKNEATLTSTKAEITKLINQSDSIKNTVGTKPTVTTTDSTAPQGQKKAFSNDYKYNAPMVSTAYFGTPSFVDTVLDGQFVDQGKYPDARQAWKGTTGGRGTMQMDKKFLSSFTAKDLGAKNFDLQKYGFKFLYNPQTVSMAWGLIQEMDPYFEATGMDKFQVVATSLLASTVSFEILLNRIEDFNFLGPNGFKDASNSQYVNTTSFAGIQAASDRVPPVVNPYPETVPPEDLKEIYNKGTMYDLEYLFKVINGPNAAFKSDLNGQTADRGWMKPVIVELHLGNAMRYRVRISEFAVNHIIFNNRMVPILSTVKFTCSRFADGLPDKAPLAPSSDNTTPSSTTTTGGSKVYTGPRGRRG